MNENKPAANIILNRVSKLAALSPHMQTKNIFLLTAGEGTGKTGFALSIGAKYFERTVYYQITQKDKTPEYFCRNLYKAMRQSQPDFVSEHMEQAEKTGITPLEVGNLLSFLLRAYKKNSRIRTLIIIDDIHILKIKSVTYLALMSALQLAGGSLSFAVCTHKTNGFPAEYARLNRETYIIDESYLKLTQEEFKELSVACLQDTATFRSLERIYEITEGIISYAEAVICSMAKTEEDTFSATAFAMEACEGIFSAAVKKLSPEEYHLLQKLSLLPSFSTQLLSLADSTGSAGKLMQKLHEETVLVIKKRNDLFRFNRLFREWLKNEAVTRLSVFERHSFYELAAGYEAERQNLPAVIEYMISAENFDKLEEYLQKNFPAIILIETKRHLADIFSTVPADVFRNRAWIPLAFGQLLLAVAPEKTRDIFFHTLDTFTMYGNRAGTIISACGLLSYYSAIEGNLTEAEKYFVRIKSMMTETCDELEDPMKMIVCAAYGLGCFNFKSGQLAAEYLSRSLALAEKYNAESFKLHLYSLFISAHMTACEKKLAEKYCNITFQKIITVKQEGFLKLSMLNLLNHFLAMTGQFHLMHLIMNLVQRKYRLHMEHSFRLTAFADICELEYAFSRGDTELAEIILSRLTDSNIKNLPEHMAALLLGFKAMILAYECDENAASVAEASLKARSCEVNNFFTAFGEAAAGAAYTFIGNHKKAILHLTKAANQEKNPVNDNAAACAHSYLSYLFNNIGDKMRAREHAIFCIKLMKKIGYTHLSGLMPEVLLNTCIYTANEPSVSAFSVDLAFQKLDTAFDKNTRPIPVMHITALDNLSISFGQNTLDCSDISVQFRTMLAIILSSPGFTIDQEQMQVFLWSESSRENARRSLDNLLSRFRKLLADTFSGIDPKNYITLQNGMLKIHNIKCDSERFNLLIKTASESYSRGEYISAAISIAEAETLFKGRFFDGITDVLPVESKRRETDVSFMNMLKLMNSLHYFMPEIFSPETLFDRFFSVFIHETDMVAMTYSFYAQNGKIQKCRNVLDKFSEFLDREGYSKAEKTELIYIIKSAALR
ncbi:AAA family ATPase [Seleniivibrio woodruffii]|uniref:AAA family ATPase n=1 Tax=Seleniivibrio woodruffii TaxID=1078050 RepID=UPI0026F1EB9A|nr:AAA family ATPase [Seleniivibrio woodruffii]